jgi:hypothetical protein
MQVAPDKLTLAVVAVAQVVLVEHQVAVQELLYHLLVVMQLVVLTPAEPRRVLLPGEAVGEELTHLHSRTKALLEVQTVLLMDPVVVVALVDSEAMPIIHTPQVVAMDSTAL